MNSSKIIFDKELIKKPNFSKSQDFHNLMRFRIRDILLVSSYYDSYIFEEEGRLYEAIRKEYHGLNLSYSAELIHVANGEEAIKLARDERRFDLIIVTQHIEDMDAITFAEKVKEACLNIPIVLLGYDNTNFTELLSKKEIELFDRVFIWQGDYRIIIGIVKYFEDRFNIDNDIQIAGVQSIILVEDDVRFYSSYLPLLYSELYKQAQSLISEGISLAHKFLRMRARPKILLCSTYEEASHFFNNYKENILGIISDIDFSHDGKRNEKAGFAFCEEVKKNYPDIPILIQSTVDAHEELAKKMGACFVFKNSPTLLNDVGNFLKENFGFGYFNFRDEKGNEYGTAKNLVEFEKHLAKIPDECISYHAALNHFSKWFKARTEFWLAYQLRPKKISDFTNPAGLRKYISDKIHEFGRSRQTGVISDFNIERFDPKITFARIGGGSIGGKARGLGFLNNLLSSFEIRNHFTGVEVFVPSALVVSVDIFDQFLEDNNLRDFALNSNNDEELRKRFAEADVFPEFLLKALRDFLKKIREPLAIRSSSLLEDSQDQPFAGIYETIMLPNNEDDLELSLKRILDSIKQIYVSVFFRNSKDYISITQHRLEEEKMAVIVQRIIGAEHNKKYYPEISGVARSFNFYPVPPFHSNDGIVSAALGLGKVIVEGGNAVRFCTKYPRNIPQFATIKDTVEFSPKCFFALDMNPVDSNFTITGDSIVKKYDISEAYPDGTLNSTGSTYSSENESISDGVSREGMYLFTLAPILKYKIFPFTEIIELLMEMGKWGMNSPVEIEFAVNLSVPKGQPIEFAVLQMRPLIVSKEQEELDIEIHETENVICKSDNVLGNGIINNIYDFVFVDPAKFDRKYTREVADEINKLNSKLIHENKKYILAGLGRWGSLDPWLGIPVSWDMINGARAIIESNFHDFNVTPSQGSHFFQNLTSFKVGYFTVNNYEKKGLLDWNWLQSIKPYHEKNFIKHLRFENPITIKINGMKNKGVILKPF